MQPKPAIGSVYIIVWHDASFSSEQGDGNAAEIGCLCESIGFLVKSNRSGVRLAMERDTDMSQGEYRYFMDIPRKMIKTIRKLNDETTKDSTSPRPDEKGGA